MTSGYETLAISEYVAPVESELCQGVTSGTVQDEGARRAGVLFGHAYMTPVVKWATVNNYLRLVLI